MRIVHHKTDDILTSDRTIDPSTHLAKMGQDRAKRNSEEKLGREFRKIISEDKLGRETWKNKDQIPKTNDQGPKAKDQ